MYMYCQCDFRKFGDGKSFKRFIRYSIDKTGVNHSSINHVFDVISCGEHCDFIYWKREYYISDKETI